MHRFRILVTVVSVFVGMAASARSDEGSTTKSIEGLITKASNYSVDVTLDRLETALKAHGFMIFARLDHAAAAAAVGLKMPRETVLVFGNPRLGTPNFIKYPTLAIDLPIKALVWEDTSGKVWLSYNSQKYLYDAAYARHGAPVDTALTDKVEGLFATISDSVTK